MRRLLAALATLANAAAGTLAIALLFRGASAAAILPLVALSLAEDRAAARSRGARSPSPGSRA